MCSTRRTVRQPDSPKRRHSTGSSTNRRICAASCSASPAGNVSPVSPSTSISPVPPVVVPITTSLAAMASSTLRAKGSSHSDGKSKTSCCASTWGTSGAFCCAQEMNTVLHPRLSYHGLQLGHIIGITGAENIQCDRSIETLHGLNNRVYTFDSYQPSDIEQP